MAEAPSASDRVLLAASLVPPGEVATYGDLGALTGVGPRQVGAVMRESGSAVAWWRVVGHDGRIGPLERALAHWDVEGIGLRADGRGCAIRRHRTDLAALAAEYAASAAGRGWPSDA